MKPLHLALVSLAALLPHGAQPVRAMGPDREWRVVEGPGDHNYYRRVVLDGMPAFHAQYPVGAPTVTLGRRVPDDVAHWHHLRWRWRVEQFPAGGNETRGDKQDSAGAVYVAFGTIFHRQSIKYVWSTTLPRGTVVGPVRDVFFDIVTVVLEGPGGRNVWKTEDVDFAADWARFYGEGKPNAAAPEVKGLGLLTDGDQTRSAAAADYEGFVLSP